MLFEFQLFCTWLSYFFLPGDAILSGSTTLTLTAPILILLNRSFQAITEGILFIFY